MMWWPRTVVKKISRVTPTFRGSAGMPLRRLHFLTGLFSEGDPGTLLLRQPSMDKYPQGLSTPPVYLLLWEWNDHRYA
jgi:hypothetical protein